MNKIQSILRCRKGIETTPFLLIFSAIVMVVTLSIVMPALLRWWNLLEKQRAVHETERLVEGIHNAHLIGDLGTIEKIELNLPQGYYINVLGDENQIQLREGDEIIRIYALEEDIEYIDYEGDVFRGNPIGGYSVITVHYWNVDLTEDEKRDKKYIIQVKGYRE